MKILLVWPKTPFTYCGYEYILPMIGKKSANVPIGILTVAAMLPESWELKFIDMNVDNLTNDDVRWADMIFISAMLIQKESFNYIVELCNLLDKSVVAGGPYATHNYNQIKGVSYFVLNEAEITLPLFLNDLKNGVPKHIYKTKEKADLTTTPVPRIDLVNLKDYACVSVQFSRGCPFNCEFCDVVELFGRRIRTKINEQIIKEFDQLYKYNWKGNIFIADDNFIGSVERAKSLLIDICKWQKEHKYPFSIFTEVSINVSTDDELLELFKEAGFGMLFLGIETPEKNSLIEVGKKQNVKIDLLDSIHKIQKKGIEVVGGFIVGFDHDRKDIFKKQKEFIEKANIPSAVVGILTALPGTKLYKRLKKEGRLLRDSSGGINTHSSSLDFSPTMGHDKLISGYVELMEYLYSPKNYFNRCLSLLKMLDDKKHFTKFQLIYINYLIKSIIIQTFSSYSIYYMWYIIRALLIKPRLFAEIFRMSIEGHHFFKMVKINS